MHCVTLKQKNVPLCLHLNFIVFLTFSSLFFHIARTPFPRRFKPTPSGHLHSEEICISKSNEKLGYMYLDIISAVGQPARSCLLMMLNISAACQKWRSISSLHVAWGTGGRVTDRLDYSGALRAARPRFSRGWLSRLCSPRSGGPVRKHPPDHAGDEQRSDAFRRGEQRQWLSKFRHVLRQLRGPVQEAHGAPRRLQPPLAGQECHAEQGQLSASETLLQAQVENPKPVRC